MIPSKLVYMGMGLDLGIVQTFPKCNRLVAIDPLIAYDWTTSSPIEKAFQWLADLLKAHKRTYDAVLSDGVVKWSESNRMLSFWMTVKGSCLKITLLLYGIDEFVRFAPKKARRVAENWDMYVNSGCARGMKKRTRKWFFKHVRDPKLAVCVFGDYDLSVGFGVEVDEKGNTNKKGVTHIGYRKDDPTSTLLMVTKIKKILSK